MPAISSPSPAPVPPFSPPPARTVVVPGRGEFFLRDSGGDGDPVMLLHGWLASGDLNWAGAYGDLIGAGFRVLAIDHRGHGRGLRSADSFRLGDCADDAAAVLQAIGASPALVVGYSMGGAIAQLLARDHPDAVRGLVLSGTKMEFSNTREMRTWRTMVGFRLLIQIAPYRIWPQGLKRAGIEDPNAAAWVGSELLRHSARDVAEAGRELGRFDSRLWAGRLPGPVAVVVTTKDRDVSPRRQRALAETTGAEVFEAPVTHMGLVAHRGDYNPALLAALHSVRAAAGVGAVR